VSQEEGHVSHTVNPKDQVDSEIAIIDELTNHDNVDDVTNDEQLTTNTTTTSELQSVINISSDPITDDVINDDVTNVIIKHTDHVITTDDHVIPDDQSFTQNVPMPTNTNEGSPGEY